MMHTIEIVLILIVSALICAMGNRIRGGLWGDVIAKHVHWGSTTARIVAWGGTCMLAALMPTLAFGGPLLPALMMIPLMWLGSCCPMFKSIDLGRQDGTFWTDVGGLTLHGILSVAPAVFVLTLFHFSPVLLVVSGMSIAPCYVYAYAAQFTSPDLGVLEQDRPPFGELLFGGIVGLAIAATFMIGTVHH